MAPRHTGTIRYGFAQSPQGRILVAVSETGVCRVQLSGRHQLVSLRRWRAAHARGTELVLDEQAVREPVRQIEAFVAGDLRRFDLPLDLRGTPFQLRVWRALQKIPYGETRTYAEIALAIGSPRAVRAVGGANGRNPVPLIVPCHRVVAKDGLGGFTGGLHHKESLLALEGSLLSA